ncbi:MAG: 3-isopropylmalate dehydratase small subunit [Desulfopila sp.]|jgi:3-isopropylmalate/(R)-2-methylmalate dehydratase small subunit|nr:3-isopropylmalate dehydratase small subunit [Desulfopila sp.]
MNTFGGPALFLDRNDINTDEIIPARYLTEITKSALRPHLLEDLLLDGKQFDNTSKTFKDATVVVSRANFGCGSSREHAVWAFEVNEIRVIIAESFARIFRQNMFNCGILAIELPKGEIDRILALQGEVIITVNLEEEKIKAVSSLESDSPLTCSFSLNKFDRDLVSAGGWLAYAAQRY